MNSGMSYTAKLAAYSNLLEAEWLAMLLFRPHLELVSFLLGRPGSLSLSALAAALEGSRCIVSRTHVRPFQMSRIAFSLTPNDLATAAAVKHLLSRVLESRWSILIAKICMACCNVSIVRVLHAWMDDGPCITLVERPCNFRANATLELCQVRIDANHKRFSYTKIFYTAKIL